MARDERTYTRMRFSAVASDGTQNQTGFAGPGGGTPEKPVGTVYIGACHKGELLVKRYLFSGDRQAVRKQAANAALRLGLEVLSTE